MDMGKIQIEEEPKKNKEGADRQTERGRETDRQTERQTDNNKII